jgi:Short C-terminal domain
MILTIIFLFLLFFQNSGAITITLVLLAFVAVTLAAIMWHLKTKRRKNQAWSDYSDSLESLKLNPSNAQLNQKALALGRDFRDAVESQFGNKTYPETYIMNDINAACAGISNPQSTNQESIETRLAKLNSLKEKGLINDQEFHEKRQQILTEI